MVDEYPIAPADYKVIAEHVPIVSVDLLVHRDGGLVLGKRENDPARGEWFVPGGTVLKGESRRQAVHRVARQEIGTDVTVEKELGVYEHFYDAAETEGVDSKQYVATAYVVTPTAQRLESDEQHSELHSFEAPFPDLHEYAERYLSDLRKEGYEYQ